MTYYPADIHSACILFAYSNNFERNDRDADKATELTSDHDISRWEALIDEVERQYNDDAAFVFHATSPATFIEFEHRRTPCPALRGALVPSLQLQNQWP